MRSSKGPDLQHYYRRSVPARLRVLRIFSYLRIPLENCLIPGMAAVGRRAARRHNVTMLPLCKLGDHRNKRHGWMKKPTPGRFNLASLGSRSRLYHQPSASRNLTPQIFAPAGAVPIYGTGRPLRDSLECCRMSKAVEHACRSVPGGVSNLREGSRSDDPFAWLAINSRLPDSLAGWAMVLYSPRRRNWQTRRT